MTATVVTRREFSRIKEAVAPWNRIRHLLRGGEAGYVVPVVIPKDSRRTGWIYTTGLCDLFHRHGPVCRQQRGTPAGDRGRHRPAGPVGAVAVALVDRRDRAGHDGILSRYGQITGTLSPGRHYLWFPWAKVEAIVDTSTEIPYTAPVVACPTHENVPLKAIEFFLKFRYRRPGSVCQELSAPATSTWCCPARCRTRSGSARARCRPSGPTTCAAATSAICRQLLNHQLQRYGVRITGSNIPDVQLPDQYQQHLATRERVAKELHGLRARVGADPQAAQRRAVDWRSSAPRKCATPS